ncbi:hypothetical protein N665_0197s0018 [Sinapis alba]|nr:hypothetical protein N665_0197s0018 [Sinapis alba]
MIKVTWSPCQLRKDNNAWLLSKSSQHQQTVSTAAKNNHILSLSNLYYRFKGVRLVCEGYILYLNYFFVLLKYPFAGKLLKTAFK